ncbi:putative quinol monooxygenase [Rhizobium sp. Pop5]|uniref:putative quinol monooxygenase n=1 Tax=Rhizobium sp. Pop5 TaxID=1223565 RepID=UPI000283BACF|nr:hypothetical protein [Rhizobium sp. Pop5]EJZ21814.1 hypothetical protein RCCGEPOP_08005 [Rhizobium sp. Pop5]
MDQSNGPNDETGKVRLSGQLICASLDEIDIVQKYLPEHIRLTRAEPGCLSFEVTQTEDPMIWRVENVLLIGLRLKHIKSVRRLRHGEPQPGRSAAHTKSRQTNRAN